MPARSRSAAPSRARSNEAPARTTRTRSAASAPARSRTAEAPRPARTRSAPAAPRSSYAEKRARNRPIREAQRAAAELLADDDLLDATRLDAPDDAVIEPAAEHAQADTEAAPSDAELSTPAPSVPAPSDPEADEGGPDEHRPDEDGPDEDAPAPRKRRVIEGPAKGPARTRGKRDRSPAAEPVSMDALVEAARKSLDDDKAEDIVVLDVTGRADYADRLIIASGLADRQIQAMAQHLEDALEKAGLRRRLRFEGLGSSDWVLVDAGDLWIHLFKPDARQAYGLERMWGPDSPSAENVVLIGQADEPMDGRAATPDATPDAPEELSDGEE